MDANNEAEFGALRRILQLSADAFSLTLATCNSPRLRESLFSRLRREGCAFKEIAFALGCPDPVAEVQNVAKTDESAPNSPIFVTGLDYLLAESTPGADGMLAVINRSRERWRDAFPKRALVFWVSDHATTRMMVHAPDFRAWVSHELEFREEESSSQASGRIDHGTLSRNYLWLSNLDASGKRTRLAELERRVGTEPPEPALLQAWARAWDEKLTLLIALGEWDEAERHARSLLGHYPADREDTLIWRAETYASLADILSMRGQLDEALRMHREEELPVFELLGNIRDIAVTKGKIADILRQRGQIDEALRIRLEEVLPVFERLGALREVAVTKGQIADILRQRGQLDEALRIRREEELPVYEKLGAIRDIAVTKGKIADILSQRGQIDEALRIHREEELPIHERLGAIREIAVTKGQIADILRQRGELDEALRIRREEELPVYEGLGAIGEIAVTKGKIADILSQRGHIDEALRIRREEELPVYERLGAIHDIAVCRANIAAILFRRGSPADRQEGLRNLILAWLEAGKLNLPDVKQIEQIARHAGWGRKQFTKAVRKFEEHSLLRDGRSHTEK